MGAQALMEQECFIQYSVGIYTVLQGSFFQQSEVIQSSPTLCDPMNCSLPGSSVHGVFHAIVSAKIKIKNPDLQIIKET